MPSPSLTALACDLIGQPWDTDQPSRPSVADAARSCPRGQVMAAERGGEKVAVCVLEDGRAFVLPDRCPHDGGLLSDGFVDRGRLVCGRHGWEFDPATGKRLFPAARPGCDIAATDR